MVECLLHKCKALSSNPSPIKKNVLRFHENLTVQIKDYLEAALA
jgi:hypothetical protein